MPIPVTQAIEPKLPGVFTPDLIVPPVIALVVMARQLTELEEPDTR